MKGISTIRYCTQNAECIKAAGYDFVFRYYSLRTRFPEKIVTVDEIKAIGAAGLQLAICYEYGGDHSAYFTQSTGERDGNYAYQFAQRMHQPPDSAIYFAVDYDPELPEIVSGIRDYFRGVLSGFNSSSHNQPLYQIGAYGSGVVCEWLRNNLPFVNFSWLAMPEKWSGRDSYDDWNVKQSKATEDLCGFKRYRNGLDADYETIESNTANFGQFTPTTD
jgi:hypothetical protein